MRTLVKQPGVRTFLLVWAGQTLSLLGSGLTAFSLGVWVFQRSASTTQYALVTFCAAVPPLVILPLAGPLIDRCARRRLLVACDLVGAATTAAVGALAWSGHLSLGLVCVIVAVNSSASAVQWPAWSAAVTQLVPREHLGRAIGLTQLAVGMSQVLSPAAAGVLVTIVGLAGITVIDFATFLFSVATLLGASFPAAAASERAPRRYWRDVPVGWRYILSHQGLAALLAMFAAVNFLAELASVLFTPLLLTISTPAALGSILALGGIGMIGGGALMTVWGGPRSAALGSAGFAALVGISIAAAGLTTSVPLLAGAAALFFFAMPLLSGSNQVTWQRAVPAGLQGRVFSARSAVAMAAVPLASLLAGPLADRLFEPAMRAGRPLARLLGPLTGAGPGRGIAVILIAAGSLGVLAALAAAAYGPLRRLDESRPAADAPAVVGARAETNTA